MHNQRSRGWGLAGLLVASGCYGGLDHNDLGPGGASADDGGGTADDGGSGDGDDDGGSDGAASLCETPSPGASPIRRLTAWEFDNTVRDLLDDTSSPSQTIGFPQEGGSGFDNNADVSSVTWLMANKYMLASEDVAARAVTDLDGLLGCDAVADEAGCITGFVEDFGARAWRRPLTANEQTAMVALFNDARDSFPVGDAVELLLQAFLQSPHFLYRVELGVGDEQGDAVVALSSWEMASRLSYFLWGTMPDPELFEAAEAGELSSREQIEAQARRMLDAPQSRAMVGHFAEQWLGYHELSATSKDPESFPEWTSAIATKQHDEASAFFEHVMFEDDATLSTLLTAPYTFVDAELAAYYGLDAPEAGASMTRVTPTGQDVAGILSQGGVLTVFSKPNQTNPIARGIFVREHLLCQIPPPPPDDVNINPPVPDPNATTREQYDQHRDDPACAGCHILFDPVGFGFENFDAVGRWRTTENGFDVDASGELASTDVNGTFVGVTELGESLAASEMVASCVARQWFRFANGRTESPVEDACNLEVVGERFTDSGYDMRELLVALTQADSFRFRTAYAAEGGN